MISHVFIGVTDSIGGAYFRDPDGNKLCIVCHADRQHMKRST
jgi:hypothetical protein